MSGRRWLCDTCGVTTVTYASLQRDEARRQSSMVRGVSIQRRTTTIVSESFFRETDSEPIMSPPMPTDTGDAGNSVRGENDQEEEDGCVSNCLFLPLPFHSIECESNQVERTSQLSYALSSNVDPFLPSDNDIAEADFPFWPDNSLPD